MALVYHYCGPQTFLKIIENKCIWLSSSNNMNDFAEGELVTKALEMVLELKILVYGQAWCDAVWRHYVDNSAPKYIICFSKNKDSLSQWRAYAQDGEGVSIGFDDEKFGAKGEFIHANTKIEESLCISDVQYKDYLDIRDELITQSDIARKKYPHDPDSIEKSSVLFASYCLALAMTIKNPAFKEEAERRLVYSAHLHKGSELEKVEIRNPIGDIHHRISNGYLTSYFEKTFPNKGAIKEIVLGPKNKFHDIDMRNFLGLNGLEDVAFTRSTATYR